MDLQSVLDVANVSDTGRRRPHNEDSSATDTALGLAVIADGMGGYKAGEVASAIAVTSIMNEVREGLEHLREDEVDPQSGLTRGSLLIRQAITNANRYIYSTAQTEPQCQGMGTTVVVLMLYDDKLTVAHVGDSRLYRLRNGTLEQVTSDHSLIQELIDRGFFTPEEAAENTPKNLVTRALGIEEQVEVDVHEEPVLPGDTYLLCTDGLNDMVNDEEIRLTLSKYSANLDEAARELVRLANESGGKDNISVVLVRPRGHFPVRTGWLSKAMRWFR